MRNNNIVTFHVLLTVNRPVHRILMRGLTLTHQPTRMPPCLTVACVGLVHKWMTICHVTFVFVCFAFYIPPTSTYETSTAGWLPPLNIYTKTLFSFSLPPHSRCPSVSSNDPNTAEPSCPPGDAAEETLSGKTNKQNDKITLFLRHKSQDTKKRKAFSLVVSFHFFAFSSFLKNQPSISTIIHVSQEK